MATDPSGGPPAALLDVDGTLVDSNYQHTLAWQRAFAHEGITIPTWRLHRLVGMGGDQLVAAAAGEQVEADRGDALRAAESAIYSTLVAEVRPLPGARELVARLAEEGRAVVLCSSGQQHEVDASVELLDVGELITAATSSADVRDSKPAPDLVDAALERAGGGEAVMVGDSIWDLRAAQRAGVTAVAVRCGGFGDHELRDAGAAAIRDDPADLLERSAGTPLWP